MVTALHATAKETAWVECDGAVQRNLYLKDSPASVGLLPQLLAKDIKVMMFAGDQDLICNYKGIERMLDHMDWQGETGMGVSRCM